MSSEPQNLRLYQELADWYERQAQPQMRDRFLLLAADAALAQGQAELAEDLRLRLLQHSPHHMLKPFASFAEALRSPDVQGYIGDLRETYPPETAQQMLDAVRRESADSIPPDRNLTAPLSPVLEPPPPTRTSSPAVSEPLKVYRVREDGSEVEPRPTRPSPPACRRRPPRTPPPRRRPRGPPPPPPPPAGPPPRHPCPPPDAPAGGPPTAPAAGRRGAGTGSRRLPRAAQAGEERPGRGGQKR